VSNFLSTRLFQVGETRVTVSSLLLALAIIVGSLVLARIARQFVADRLLGKTRLAVGTRYAIGRVLGYVILFLGLLVALQPLGVNATTLAVFGGALGIGLGFGLQDVVKNFVAGLILLVERPIQIGDSIEIGDVVGDVTEIRGRATVVRTSDDVYLIVPNSRLVSGTIVNRSFRQVRVREHVPVAVATDSDPADVEAALLEAATGSESILADPPPRVWFREFGESALKFELLCWTSKMLHSSGELRSELNHRIFQTLRARGIEIPAAHLNVVVREDEPPRKVLEGRDAPLRSGVTPR
jgi:small-conductance mechanosensitive channel